MRCTFNSIVICLVVLFLLFIALHAVQVKEFFDNTGALVQLETTHVPSSSFM